MAVPVDMKFPGCDCPARVRRIAGLVRLPGAFVPDDDGAGAVPAGRYHALEVEVLQGVVLDVEGGPSGARVERRSPRYHPADQYPVDLQPQVVMQSSGPVPLHHETPRTAGVHPSTAPA